MGETLESLGSYQILSESKSGLRIHLHCRFNDRTKSFPLSSSSIIISDYCCWGIWLVQINNCTFASSTTGKVFVVFLIFNNFSV